MGKVLVFVGLAVAALGGLMMLGLPLGRLPGDLVFRRGNVTVYVPIATSIALSLLVALIVTMMRR
ncbi:MAG: DUF2905 domain-containing protein [Vicinamibacterales bacterium]|nr:hypothetical protein [Acidobacteriota bacterium]MDP6374017.1 DUF2905 domain-containing protein [Vicinamibacterales bacterium]MDP6609643.1 DUF2905 domain-containing protein [Vicinamibacterales bacterium]HAK55617.1 DUF2905 domain-containing protein [Acidobacteriota bacterium]